MCHAGRRNLGCTRWTCYAAHQDLNAIGDPLGGIAELGDGPVGSVFLDDFVGPRVVDQSFGERGRQHQFALGDGDETVP